MTDLKSWRLKRGLKQEHLAELLGTEVPTVSRIEKGKQWPGPILMAQIESVTRGEVTASDVLNNHHKIKEAAE